MRCHHGPVGSRIVGSVPRGCVAEPHPGLRGSERTSHTEALIGTRGQTWRRSEPRESLEGGVLKGAVKGQREKQLQSGWLRLGLWIGRLHLEELSWRDGTITISCCAPAHLR